MFVSIRVGVLVTCLTDPHAYSTAHKAIPLLAAHSYSVCNAYVFLEVSRRGLMFRPKTCPSDAEVRHSYLQVVACHRRAHPKQQKG